MEFDFGLNWSTLLGNWRFFEIKYDRKITIRLGYVVEMMSSFYISTNFQFSKIKTVSAVKKFPISAEKNV